MRKLTLKASNDRLDQRLQDVLPELSRSRIAQALRAGRIVVNPEVHGNLKLKPSLRCARELSLLYEPEEAATEGAIPAEMIALDIVYEDADILIINKPAGMPVHPTQDRREGTLVNALLAYTSLSFDPDEPDRPGIVHRLDADTTGLLVVARNDAAHRALKAQWFGKKPQRVYLALVHGAFPEDQAEIRGTIGRDPQHRQRMAVVSEGREAVTYFSVRERFGNAAELRCTLDTGRTHQIRVHLATIGHPIYGDPLYGHGRKDYRKLPVQGEVPPAQCLHAASLTLRHPRTGERLSFRVDPPTSYGNVKRALKGRTK